MDSHSDNIELQRIISSRSPDNDESTYITTRHGKVKRKGAEDIPNKKLKTRGPSEETSSQSPGPNEEATSQTPVTHVSLDHGYIVHDTVPGVDLEHFSEPLTPQSSPYKSSSYSTSDLQEQHNYCLKPKSACTCSCVCEKCKMKEKYVQETEEGDGHSAHRIDMQDEFLQEREDLESRLAHERHCASLPPPKHYDISSIMHSDDLIHMHTGLQNYALFQWLFNQVQSKLPSIHYFKGVHSQTVKKYQLIADKKPGPQRKLAPENELLLTLMKLKLNLSLQFLAHLFKICTSVVSQIICTWVPLLSKELEPLIYWPQQEEIHMYYPECFKKYKYVRAIIDSTY